MSVPSANKPPAQKRRGAKSSASNALSKMPASGKAVSGRAGARLLKGERTRESILHVAVNLASVEGLQGLSIGRLAEELKMSKSGLFAHFGSKEELQLATVQMARTIFVEAVVVPALKAPEGAPRLLALCDGWLRYVEDRVFAGGCFFTAASFEFDSRTGPVRDSIAAAMKAWLEILTRAVEGAQKARHLHASIDARQLAYEVYSLAMGAQWGFQLLDDKQALSKSHTVILDRIRALATQECPAL